MRAARFFNRISDSRVAVWFVPVIFFWVLLAFKIPYFLTAYFHHFHTLVFLGILILFYFSFRLRADQNVLATFGMTMLLFALTLSYLWTSGFSDNFLIGGLLPYKDAKNYYLGATLLLNGLPIRVAGQAVGRPLFPGFLSSLLLLTGQNLKVTVALLVQLAGIGVYLSARQIHRAMGAVAGALYITFMYFYFQTYSGYTLSESLGFIGGCFAFVLLWRAAQDHKWFDLLLGLGILLVAVSARAGAFFIFPMLALWTGWLFRGEKRFSLLSVLIVLAILVGGYFILNGIYPRLLGVQEGASFGNFAYTIYGQVRGGIGWHSAIDELGTRNSSRVYQAALDIFLANPSGFLQGAVKAYIGFFLPTTGSIFMFSSDPLGLVFWFLAVIALLRGLYQLVIKLRSGVSTLLLAGFLGIFFSIPFLPPIDGGNRFYAGTMPFFFVVLAVGAGRFFHKETPAPAIKELFFSRFVSVSLLALTVLLPPLTLRVASRSTPDAPACSPEHRPFVVRVNQGSYLDLVQEENSSCGLAPNICLDDFRQHNTELRIDDFYQELDALVATSPAGIRIVPALNLLDGYFQYFVVHDSQVLAHPSQEGLSGCASRILTENQRIFWVEPVSYPAE